MAAEVKPGNGSVIWSLFRRDHTDDCADSSVAPARYRGPDPAPPFTWRRAMQNMGWVYAFGLIFLVFAAASILDGDPSSAVIALRVLMLVAVAAGYLGTAWMADCSLRARWGYLAGYAALLLLSMLVWGWDLVGYGVYVAVMMASLLPWRQSRIAIPVWSGLLLLTIPLGAGSMFAYAALISFGAGLATAAGMEAGAIQGRLEHAERRVSTLSVAAERERIGRDLHDILGHSLTAISIKAGLAARLVDVDPVAAKSQLADIEQVARQALSDVRATASAMREVRLATEVASARSVLMAAGIESRVPSAVPALTDELSELFGYVVREGVTNVVRHSGAAVCTITVEPTVVEVRDDGHGLPAGGTPGQASGSGLAGLRSRVAAAGGTLQVSVGTSGGTVLRAELTSNDAGPARSAAHRAVTVR